MIGGEREVVKLSLGEGRRTLNVIPAGLEGETLTLVCPFPVLPLEMPVSVTLPGEEGAGPVEAVIRRVGVELQGESELPRFKLHLAIAPQTAVDETDEAEEEAAAEVVVDFDAGEEADGGNDIEQVDEEAVETVPSPELPTASTFILSEMNEEGGEAADLGGDTIDDSIPDAMSTDPAKVSWSQGDDLEWPDPSALASDEFAIEPDELTDSGSIPLDFDDEDPPWTEGEEFAPPRESEIPEEQPTRWPVKTAVTLAFIISILAVGYVMRGPLIEAIEPVLGEDLSLTISGFGFGAEAEEAVDPIAEVERSTAPAARDEAEPGVAAVERDEADEADVPPPADEASEEPAEIEAESSAPTPEPDGAGAEEEEAEVVASPSVENEEDALRVMLPTRWPVTTASSYRLHDPTGIVVDVPGGMASERARWIDTSDERVRSIRVLERDDGVRFVIYLNDPVVPRYRVGYSRGGVTVDILGPDPRHSPDEPLVAQVTR